MPTGTFRVLVTGSRTWTNIAVINTALTALQTHHGPGLVVVHGACRRGADAIAGAWCQRTGTPVERHPADWTTGRAAGHRRNAAMVATQPDLCFGFIRNASPGATGRAALAQTAGIPTIRHTHTHTHTRTHTHTHTSEDTPMSHPTTRSLAGRYLPAALDYAAEGLPVFLLGRTKRPVANCADCRLAGPDHDREACACLTCHGFYAATTDPDRLRAIFDAIPDGLLAVRTGAASRRLVVDIDPAHGGAIDRALMAPTATVATGGGGWHLHYAHPGVPVLSRPLPGRRGVDIKADGGYVLAPPSVHPRTRRPYQWIGSRPVDEMPPPLLAACLAEPEPAAPPNHRPITTTSGRGISDPDALLAANLQAIADAEEGKRRTTLYGAARGVARIVAAGAITRTDAEAALIDAGREAQQTDRDIRAAIAGAFRAEGVPA